MAKKPTEYIEIEIDDQVVQVPKTQPLLWSARDLGFDIPHFCAHRWLEPFGGCRMCMVKCELGGRMMPKLQTACSLLPAPGMKIWTAHPEVIQARREQLEFHLLNHPLECPVCDKGGECMLQDQTMDHGMGEGRFIEQKRIQPDKLMNAYVRLNYKRCIHCKRCIHFCEDVDGSYFLRFLDRGAETYIDTFADPAVAPRFTGNVIDMCPVGALTAREYRFTMGRPWEQEPYASVGSLDAAGANIWINARLGEIARIIPRDNPEVENGFLDDATRFGWECLESEHRATRAIIRETSGETVVSRAAGEERAAGLLRETGVHDGPHAFGVIAGPGLNTEEYLALRRFCEALGTGSFYFGDCLDQGLAGTAAEAAILTEWAGKIDEIVHASTVLSIGCDLFEEAPVLGLRIDLQARRGQLKLLSLRSHGREADRFATAHATYPYGSLLATIQALTQALTGGTEPPDQLKSLATHLRDYGEDLAIVFGQEVWASPDRGALLSAIAGLREALAKARPDAVGVYFNPIYPAVNSAGAMVVQRLGDFGPTGAKKPVSGPSLRSVLEDAAAGKLQVLVVVDCDLLTMYPDRALVEKALGAVSRVIYIGTYPNPTSEKAALHLPLGTWAHREGTVASLEWRVQKRNRVALDTFAPSVLDVLNGILTYLDQPGLAADTAEMADELTRLLPWWPSELLDQFPAAGVLARPQVKDGMPAAAPVAAPASEAGQGLRLIAKSFMYNSRPEVRFSPVFDNVALPCFAYFSPADMAKLGLAEGGQVRLSTSLGEIVLPVQGATWVPAGSVVVNDYYIMGPANLLGRPGQTWVAIEQAAPVTRG